MLVLLVSVFGKDGAETCVYKDTCLGEAVYPFVDLNHDMSMFNEGEELVLLDDLCWERQ